MIDDAKLIAYVAGELNAQGRAEVEAALAIDPLLASRLARHRDRRSRDAESAVALEAAPRRRRAGGAAETSPGNIVRLADRRTPPRARIARPFKWPSWSPVVISLGVGVIGGYALSHRDIGPLAVRSDGVLAVHGELAAALEQAPSGEAGPIRMGLSFRTADRYCRVFQMDARRLAGVACKEGPGWVAWMTATSQKPDRARPTPLPPAVLTAVGQMMQGRSLDQAGEDAARRRGWKF
jgi:hypothetical protein